MKKKLIAMVVSAAAVIPAAAMADVDVYGRVHVSTDFLDDGADYSEVNISRADAETECNTVIELKPEHHAA